MTSTVRTSLFGTLLLLNPPLGAQGALTTFDFPGAVNTFALDINAEGVIVGRYLKGGQVHGFVRSAAGDLTSIDVPGALRTVAAAINDRGDIAGSYFDALGAHGFLLSRGRP